jgi:protocatechuate 3,4-dioxygenase beta subunit
MNENNIIDRRKALALLAGGGAAAVLAACTRSSDSPTVSAGSDSGAASTSATSSSSSASSGSSGASSSTTVAGAAKAVGRIPEETAGPYPGDGTNGPNALTQAGIVRSDIRSSVGTGSAKADGVPLTIELTIVDADTGQPLPEAAVYLWHCDRIGRYSMYASGLGAENYLRGVQAADANGALRFTTIFPGAYDGRWPHIHFHVFDSQSQATNGRNARVTSQLALPESTCDQVYAASGYESSARNLDRSSLSSDMVFRDGVDLQVATVTGSNSAGYTARLTVGA